MPSSAQSMLQDSIFNLSDVRAVLSAWMMLEVPSWVTSIKGDPPYAPNAIPLVLGSPKKPSNPKPNFWKDTLNRKP